MTRVTKPGGYGDWMAMSTSPLVLTGLSKKYGSTTALDRVDLELDLGEVFGLLGPNGAGKTTMIRIVLGLLRATAGSAAVFGQDVWSRTKEAHRHLAYVPGETSLWPELTGAETIHALGALRGGVDRKRVETLVDRFGLDPSKRIRAYSKGNRQKVVLVAAFASAAPLLVLDEPSNGLDPLMEKVFRETLSEAKRNGQTILLSSHILSEVEAVCDRVGILRAGKLVETGTLQEMRHLSAVAIEATFDKDVPDLTGAAGVTDVMQNRTTLRCHVSGPVTEVIQRISAARPVRLISKEPSLEELFLSRYGDS